LANILEDHQEDIKIHNVNSTLGEGEKMESEIKLNFRGFEIKTVKLTVEKIGKKSGSGFANLQSDGWIKL
jgi:hypothetical protein